jgi:xylulokinase
MAKVVGVDSSTQSVKVVLRDVDSGELIASASRAHPDGTEVAPEAWWQALSDALSDIKEPYDAISIAGQQHGMVALDNDGKVIRDALLWNDTRSDRAAEKLNQEIPDIHERTGSKLVASFTASKVRWLAESEKDNASKVSAVALPHDWLSWKLTGSDSVTDLFTDRSDASGTGYFDSKSNEYQRDIFAKALLSDREVVLPKVIAPDQFGGQTKSGTPIAAGAGDNAGAALGLGAAVGDLVISLGTSGTAFAVSSISTHDPSGEIAGFADATGNFLPLACTLNAAKVFATIADTLGVSLDTFSELALAAPSGADGLRLLPHFDGERTPNRPNARANFQGMTHQNFTRENMARAAIEGVVGGMVFAAEALKKTGFKANRILLIGGAAKNPAVQAIAAEMFNSEITIPPTGEYVADGAARQAAWALTGKLPNWQIGGVKTLEPKATSNVASDYIELISQI